MYFKKAVLSVAIVAAVLTLVAVPSAHAVMVAGDSVADGVMVTRLDGTTTALNKLFKDEGGILVFFNTTCNSCLQEIKYLYGNFPDANIHLVSIDLGGAKRVNAWKSTYLKNVENPNLYTDPQFELAAMFGFSYTPASVLFEKGAAIKQVLTGYNKSVHGAIESVLK